MSVSRLGSLAAVVGGLAWLLAALLGWGEDELGGLLYYLGFALLVAAFAALGYALVATAPVWLRAVVTVATPVLGAMVWLIVRDSIPDGYLAGLVGGLLLLTGGGVALGRAEKPEAAPTPTPVRGRRAAR